ncbi:MAG: thioredoxin [Candidatus Micrarchaeaceae archaeon]
MSVVDIAEKDFEKEVLQSSIPVIVDVWAEWCGPCRMYSPVIEEVSKEYEGKIKFVKLNADEAQQIDAQYNIMSIPTTLLIVNGKLKAQSVGAVPKAILKKWIDENI